MLTSAASTPFIPPLPSPGGRSIRPPVVPNAEPPADEPSWAREPMNHANYPTHYPGMGTPYMNYNNLAPAGYGGQGGQGFTPFIPSNPDLHPPPPSMGPQQTPGSYFAPPRGLPPQTPHHSGGQLSADYTGYPQGPPPPANPYAHAGTPWQQSVPMPGAYPPHQTPYAQQPMMAPPGTGYSMFQQQLPSQYGGPPQHPAAWGQAPGFGHMPPQTPAMGMGMGMGMGFGGMGQMPGAWGAPPPQATPWHGAGGGLPPAAPPAPPPAQGRPAAYGGAARGHNSEGWDLLGTNYDKFSADAQSGPTLEPFLLRRVRANLSINPLLQPAEDDLKRPYIEWNMLFPTARCHRSDDKPGRSWSAGRNDAATFPRVTTLRIISRGMPWLIEVNAQNPKAGVTCGELIEKICETLHTLVNKKEMKMAPNERAIHEAYWYNRSTDGYDVPGGRLGDGVRRIDWLLNNTAFGGIVRNDDLVRAQCGGALLPCTLEMKCEPRFTPEREKEEEAAREGREGRASHRSHRSSAAPSETSTRNSRSRSRQSIRVNITH
ncbi:hypothetical protein HWV62_10629 [Athelia sp. TMB]|nr:hypothetical protein HWV62_10629 [Athelia sp. TMB]